MFVSGYTWILSSAIQQRWNDAVQADPEPESSRQRDDPFTKYLRSFLVRSIEWLQSFSIVRKSLHVYHNSIFYPSKSRQEESPAETFVWPSWLIGKQPEKRRQRNSKSKIEDEITPTTRRLDCANQILLAGSDAQTFTGRSWKPDTL